MAVVKDATAAAKLPEGDGYQAALINFRYLANGKSCDRHQRKQPCNEAGCVGTWQAPGRMSYYSAWLFRETAKNASGFPNHK